MLIQFFYGLCGSLIGGIAVGPINLSVVELTIKKNIRAASRFCLAAALVEIALAFIAILFGKLISRKIDEFPELKFLVILFFFILGLYFILKRDKPKSELNVGGERSSFIKGLIVAVLNPQTIPYWIFVLAYLKSASVLQLQAANLWLFLLGVAVGKYTMLTLYSHLSLFINRHVSNLHDYISKTIGFFLIVVGLIQAIRYFYFP
jgi:threonine/homoserine/homoserine lactone efflux protein